MEHTEKEDEDKKFLKKLPDWWKEETSPWHSIC